MMTKDLQVLQADTYLLLIKTQNFHWNVKGPFFQSLHTLFENEYNELFSAVDEIAERIRANGERALGCAEDFEKHSTIKGSHETHWKDMIKELVKDNETVIANAKKLITSAEEEGDEATADLAISRQTVHEKAVWMLKSHLEE